MIRASNRPPTIRSRSRPRRRPRRSLSGTPPARQPQLRSPDTPADATSWYSARRAAASRSPAYRGGGAMPELRGRTVILVDDGLATGATRRAAALAVRRQRVGEGRGFRARANRALWRQHRCRRRSAYGGDAPDLVAAVVARGGRVDLAGDALANVRCPMLMLVGSEDPETRRLNRAALAALVRLPMSRIRRVGVSAQRSITRIIPSALFSTKIRPAAVTSNRRSAR